MPGYKRILFLYHAIHNSLAVRMAKKWAWPSKIFCTHCVWPLFTLLPPRFKNPSYTPDKPVDMPSKERSTPFGFCFLVVQRFCNLQCKWVSNACICRYPLNLFPVGMIQCTSTNPNTLGPALVQISEVSDQ